MSMPRIDLFLLNIATAALLCIGTAWGAPYELSEQDLSDVSGQGFVTLANSSYPTTGVGYNYDFSTIALNADVTLNANINNLYLGQYDPAIGAGMDIKIDALQFGRSDGTAAQRLVQISNPYLQFVYDNSVPGNSQVIGLRLGFDGITGDIGLKAESISGTMQVVDGAGADVLNFSGKRMDNSTCTTCSGTLLTSPTVNGITAGNASGASRDFWISLLATPVNFAPQPGMTAPIQAQAGYWMNWTDRLTVINTGTGLPPPNLGH